jgi:hypothetical protein
MTLVSPQATPASFHFPIQHYLSAISAAAYVPIIAADCSRVGVRFIAVREVCEDVREHFRCKDSQRSVTDKPYRVPVAARSSSVLD